MKRARAIPNTAEHKEDHSSDTSSSENTTTAASTSSSESSSNDVTEYLANTGERTNPKLQKKIVTGSNQRIKQHHELEKTFKFLFLLFNLLHQNSNPTFWYHTLIY